MYNEIQFHKTNNNNKGKNKYNNLKTYKTRNVVYNLLEIMYFLIFIFIFCNFIVVQLF